MKKYFITILFTISILVTFTISSSAIDENITEGNIHITSATEYIPTDDGGHITVALVTKNISTKSPIYIKTGDKYVTKYDTDGEIVWRYTLTGTFSVNSGISATCADVTYSTTDNSAWWTFSDCSATTRGNKAIGTGTAEHRKLFIIVDEIVNIDISITCDKNGNLS